MKLKPGELKIDVFRAKGCKDVTQGSNAVRITHLPTGAMATCEKYKSYHQNRDVAMKELLDTIPIEAYDWCELNQKDTK